MSEHLFKMTYEVHCKPEGLTKAELETLSETHKDLGGCDAILLASILYPEDGSLSVLFIGHDGRTEKELEDHEWFKVWSLLTHRLAQSKTLGKNKKELCALVFETIAASLRG